MVGGCQQPRLKAKNDARPGQTWPSGQTLSVDMVRLESR